MTMLSISNIAWNPDEEAAAAELIAARGLRHVDIAPGRYFPDPALARDSEIAAVRRWWDDRGLEICGMQALLFGTTGLNLFDDPEDRMLDRLGAVCRLAAGLGARALTFGSPRQRDRAGLDDQTAEQVALAFFDRLGERADSEGVIVCLEPNAPAYGCNFMTNNAQTAHIVRTLEHPAIRLQLDVGNLAMNDEPAAKTIADVAPLVGHIHLSEPHLAPLDEGNGPHREASGAIAKALPGRVMTIEMVRPESRPALEAIAQAIDFARCVYDGDGERGE